MAHKKFDGVQQLATGTGTGALTLGAATQAYYRTMQAAGGSNGDTLTCRIQHETLPAEWEEVLVTYSAGTITRTYDTNAKSATGSLISFSAGTKIVSNVIRAGDAVVMDNNGDAAVTRDLAVTRNVITPNVLGAAGGNLAMAAPAGYTLVSGVVGSSVLVYTNAGIHAPSVTNAMALGAPALRWSDIYGVLGDFSGAVTVGGTLAVTGVSTFSTNMRFPAGLTLSVGPSPSPVHQAGNVGSITFGFADGGNFSGMRVNNTHDGTYSSQSIDFMQSQGGIYVSTVKLSISSTGMVLAGGDNTQTLGGASNRWSVVYAGTGTINTSGRDAKRLIGEATDAEKRAASTIRANPRRYKMADAIDEKGEERARWHFGYLAEDVRDALAAEGLDPWAYAFLCSDLITKKETHVVTVSRPKVRKVERQEQAVEVRDGRPVLVAKAVEHDDPVGVMMQVVDELGQIVMREVRQDEETGESIFEPMMHLIPEMEEVEEERTREVVTDEVRLGLRYSELEAFLRCAD